MSEKSNLGPIKPTPHSNSRNSLYTDHSNDSQEHLPSQIQQPHQHIQPPKHIAHQQHSHFPKIKNNNSPPPENKNNKLQHPKEQQLPKPSTYNYQRKSLQSDPFKNHVSISPISQNLRRYLPDEHQFDENPNERMLRSSQGGRWLRSKSLMTQKQQKTPQYLLRNYFRGGSMLGEQVNRYIEYLMKVEKQLNDHSHKISLLEPLQTIKNKMENYLEKKLNLDNVRIDKPSPQWTQQELTNFFTNYQPILNQKLDDLKKIKGITIKKYKNCVYFGVINNSKKQGLGVLHYYSGRFFQGIFEDDYKLEGLEMDDNEIYLGHYKKGVRNGEGILKNDECLLYGTFFEGEFGLPKARQQANYSILGFQQSQNEVSSPLIGKKGFKIEYSCFSVYENNILITKTNNNDIYIGSANTKEQKNGQGLEIFANGDVYIGKYEAGVPEGYGQYYWDSGAFYRGKFVSGMRHGVGKWQMIQGDSYQGQYLNDKKNGKGTYMWKNGVKYIGYFENDYRHGYGEMYWNDGRVYKGQWLNGIECNKNIRVQPNNNKTPVKTMIPRNSFRTLQNTSINKRKLPLDKLKSIYNPSNYVN